MLLFATAIQQRFEEVAQQLIADHEAEPNETEPQVGLRLADALIDAELEGRRPLSEVLRSYRGCNEVIDMAVLPLTYPDLREANKVDVFRISPRDAGRLVKDTPEKPKLAGVAAGHFGGFLDRGWRRSDLLRGRLDAAERLMAVLVPNVAGKERDELRIRAQAEILRHENRTAADDGWPADLVKAKERASFVEQLQASPGDDREIVQTFCEHYEGPNRKLRADHALSLAGRGIAITGDVLADATKDIGGLRKAMLWIGRFGRLLGGWLMQGVWKEGWRAVLLAIGVLALLALAVVGAIQSWPHVGDAVESTWDWARERL